MTRASGYPQPGTQWPTQSLNCPSKASWVFIVQGVPSAHPASLYQVGVPARDWVHRTSKFASYSVGKF